MRTPRQIITLYSQPVMRLNTLTKNKREQEMNKNKDLIKEGEIYDSVYMILFGAFYDVSHKKLDKITRNITKVFLRYLANKR